MQYDGKKLRHELKYFISPKTYHILRERLQYIAQRDENTKNDAGYLIGSLYFDDMFSSVYNDKIRGTRFRKKYRIRAYNRSDSLINLECKYKYDSFIAKTNARLTVPEYRKILAGDFDFLGQREETTCRELLGYNKTKLLKPSIVVEYMREAYVVQEGNVRITFDKDIETNLHSMDLFDPHLTLSPVLPDNRMVMEVKFDDFLPSYVQRALLEQRMLKCAISKFVMCKNKNWRTLHHD